MAPELQILVINATGLAVSYLLIFPSLGPLTNTRATHIRLFKADAVVLTALIATSGALFWGSGVEFRLVFMTVNWFWFALVTLIAMELPVYLWFRRRHGLTLDLDDDEG